MFLRNKKTGEVIEWDKNLTYKLDREYTSLKELCENYEDCEAPKPETWEPEDGGNYYSVDKYGRISSDKWDSNDWLDAGAKSIGNVFRTWGDAKKALAWLEARKVLFDDTKGFKPDWGNRAELKWMVSYEWSDEFEKSDGLVPRYTLQEKYFPGPYFATEEDVKASIRAHAKEWKIYLLGVEEQ